MLQYNESIKEFRQKISKKHLEAMRAKANEEYILSKEKLDNIIIGTDV